MDKTVLERAESALDEFRAAGGDDGDICVGLSGGADSVALLLALIKLSGKRGFTLSAMHIDHMLRGSESDRDREFCVSLCERLGVPLEVRRVDIKAIKDTSTEEIARRERYRCFAERKTVALAHTASDNLETMLFSLARGTSPDGVGIPLYRRNGDGYVVRPFLNVTREETELFCRENGEDFVVDSTNSDVGYTRNYIRKEIIPRMKVLSKDAVRHAAVFAELCRSDAEYFDSVLPCDGGVITAAPDTPDPILGRAVRKAAKAVGISDLDGSHIAAVSRLIRTGKRGDSVDVKGGYAVKRRGCTEIIAGRPAARAADAERIPVAVGKTVYGDGFGLTLTRDEKFSQTFKSVYNLSISATLYDDNIYGGMYLRKREPGDRIKFGGMTRSLKKLLSGFESDGFERTGRPVLCDEKGVLWFPSFPPRDGKNEGEKIYLIYGENDNARQN